MDRDNLIKQIKENWFNDHVATFKKLNDRISTLTWRKPGTSAYYIRYIFDGIYLYVSGDVGEAVFRFSEESSIDNIITYEIHYFHSKLQAFCEDKYSFSSEKAIRRIKEEIKEINELKEDYSDNENKLHEIDEHLELLLSLKRECSRMTHINHFKHEVTLLLDDLSDFDPDIYDWIYDIGNEIPSRIQGYLIGLQMAHEQLKSNG